MAIEKLFTPKQRESLDRSDGLVNLWTGAVASGKTVASAVRFLQFVHRTRDLPGQLVIVGRTRDSAWRNVLLPLQDDFPDLVQGNLGAPKVTLHGRVCHVLGANSKDSEMALRGITALAIYVDEVTTIPEGFFKMALTRLRVPGRKGGLASRLFGSTNPDNPMHWLRKDYLKRIPDEPELARDWRVFPFQLRDNTFLPESFVQSMETQFTGLFYRRFVLGEWVQGEGTIYDSFDPDVHVWAHADLPPMQRVLSVGVDYGNTHKSVAIRLGVADGRLYALDEWTNEQGGQGSTAPAVQSASFRAWLSDGPHPEFVFVDGAAASFREQLHADGQITMPAWKSVQSGLGLLHSLFTQNRLIISDRCTQLIQELPGYVWDPKHPDMPVKENDDACDALRYAVVSSRPQWQSHIPLTLPMASREGDDS